MSGYTKDIKSELEEMKELMEKRIRMKEIISSERNKINLKIEKVVEDNMQEKIMALQHLFQRNFNDFRYNQRPSKSKLKRSRSVIENRVI